MTSEDYKIIIRSLENISERWGEFCNQSKFALLAGGTFEKARVIERNSIELTFTPFHNKIPLVIRIEAVNDDNGKAKLEITRSDAIV